MSIDALLDDLEARFNSLQNPNDSLTEFSVVGFERVSLGKRHFAGFVAGTSIWQLSTFNSIEQIRLEPGSCVVDGLTIAKRLKPLQGAWLRVATADAEHRGFLRNVNSGLLVFNGLAIPIASVSRVQVHPVDNLLVPS